MNKEKIEKLKDKFELIIPEKRYILNSLKEANELIEKYKLPEFTIRRMKNEI